MKMLVCMMVIVATAVGSLQGCGSKTVKGAAAGAVIGGLAGNASKGAKIGASVGLVGDILD